MSLQTQNLVMTGLGTLNDVPPNSIQPKIVNGIHLRWAFNPELGFPWYGYFLFRRKHRKGNPQCLGSFWRALIPGAKFDNHMAFQFGHVAGDNPLQVTDDFPASGGDGNPEFDLSNLGLIQLQFESAYLARRVEVTIGFRESARIEITALLGGIPVTKTIVSGMHDQIKLVSLEFDAIDSVKISGGPAALIDVCLVLVSDEATKGWELLPDFHYPLMLPVIHPDYVPTVGVEDLEAARQLAKDRILYGDPDDFVDARSTKGKGSVSVKNGSSIVSGYMTQWTDGLIGLLLKVQGVTTAYTIIQVVSNTKLVLSRHFSGASQNNISYQVCQDTFGQLHDQLVHLVYGGPASVVKMVDRALPIPVYDSGTVMVKNGFDIVDGANTNWNADMVGLNFQVDDKSHIYSIITVYSPNQLKLDRSYGQSTGKTKLYKIFAALMPAGSGEEPPRMPRQKPLDLVLLGALHPAMAQMVGLYWVDQTAALDTAYDYLILADHTNVFRGDAKRIFSYFAEGFLPDVDGYVVFNKKKEAPPALNPPEDPRVYSLPGSFILSRSDKMLVDAQNNAGLVWKPETIGGKLLPGKEIMYHVWRAWLGEETPTVAPSVESYNPITYDRPVLITRSLDSTVEPQRPPDWPPFPLSFIDRGMDPFTAHNIHTSGPQSYRENLIDGWYSYKLSGIDIFGRHSAGSPPAQWYQWTPMPDPPPWYQTDSSGNSVINKFAVHLLDKISPPPPTGIEAYILDPDDPTVIEDKAYKNWRASLSPTVVGLRISWLWTPAHMHHAPDTHEFRIYYQPEHLNTRVGQVVSVTKTSQNERSVQTDIPNNHSADSYVGTKLNIGPDSFTVVGSEAGSMLKLRVKVPTVHSAGTVMVEGGSIKVKATGANVSKTQIGQMLKLGDDNSAYTILEVDSSTQELTLDRPYMGPEESGKPYSISKKLPSAETACNVTIPTPYSVGTIGVSSGATTVKGKNTTWREELAGSELKILGESASYTISKVDSDSLLTLKTPYQGPDREDKGYVITHPLAVDYAIANNWEKRLHVCSFNEDVTETIRIVQDAVGNPLNGDNATAVGKVVSLDGLPDLSGVTLEADSPFTAWLFLHNDSARSSKLYRITGVGKIGNKTTITVDDAPNIAGLTSPWKIGLPVRKYEVFLPVPKDKLFEPSQADPMVYANIGVSAVDDKLHTLDDNKWDTGDWGGRHGNEGRVGGMATIVRVHRERPDPPKPPPDSEKVYASLPDYHGHAFYTYRWEPKDYLKAHIFRALDDTLFKTDWSLRSKNKALVLDSTNAEHKKLFPKDWNTNKHQLVSDQLNNFVLSGAAATVLTGEGTSSSIPKGVVVLDGTPDLTKVKVGRDFVWLEADTESHSKCYLIISIDTNASAVELDGLPILNSNVSTWAIPLYDSLSNDSLRILAGLPGNEQAFTQVTLLPLDPKDLANLNRRGPDDPDEFKLGNPNQPLASKIYRAYIDTLNGRSTNRYFYRAAYVDSAHNLSRLGLSSPPVYLRSVIPPCAPVFTRVLAGDADHPSQPQDCKISLFWGQKSRENLLEYHIYRTDDHSRTRDVRLMDLVQVFPVSATQLSEYTWVDKTVKGLVTYSYRLVAIDSDENASSPSEVISARAFDTELPLPPLLIVSWDTLNNQTIAKIEWTSSHSVLLQRRELGQPWISLEQWRNPGNLIVQDKTVVPKKDYEYRARVRKYTGATVLSPIIELKAKEN